MAVIERRHSSRCIDHREVDGEPDCICAPSADAPPPDTFELWWCSYCGEPSLEWSDPCQACGESITRQVYVLPRRAITAGMEP
jgi:hypothetical protein